MYVKIIAICALQSKIWELVKIRVRAQDPGILELVHGNISCATSYMGILEHVILLKCVQKVIIFMGNALAGQWTLPPLPAYISATIEPFFCV